MNILTVSSANEEGVAQKNTNVTYKKVETNTNKLYLFSKRLVDISGALFGIILLSPVFLFVAIIIKMEDSNGPVFFKQIRLGKDGRKFHMYKFRSMVSNAEELKDSLMGLNEAKGPVFKIKDDPRVTKIGKFIRKTSIDELPQLFNVISGSMSLVGPRPPLPDEVAQYSSYERQRLNVTPGLTCYWQISGRSNIGFDEWIELDLRYINERNMIVDIKMILKTIFVLFGSKDAY